MAKLLSPYTPTQTLEFELFLPAPMQGVDLQYDEALATVEEVEGQLGQYLQKVSFVHGEGVHGGRCACPCPAWRLQRVWEFCIKEFLHLRGFRNNRVLCVR